MIEYDKYKKDKSRQDRKSGINTPDLTLLFIRLKREINEAVSYNIYFLFSRHLVVTKKLVCIMNIRSVNLQQGLSTATADLRWRWIGFAEGKMINYKATMLLVF